MDEPRTTTRQVLPPRNTVTDAAMGLRTRHLTLAEAFAALDLHFARSRGHIRTATATLSQIGTR